MRKMELGIIVAIVAGFMAYNRPEPPVPPQPSGLPAPQISQACPYVLAGPSDGLNLAQTACLFTDEKDFLRYHPGATATLKAGSVQIYSIHCGSTEERTTVVGGRVVGVSIRGTGKEFELTRDGLGAPGLGASRAQVLQSLQGHPIQQMSANTLKTTGPGWNVVWSFDSNGTVDSVHLNGWMAGHRHHYRRRFAPFHFGHIPCLSRAK